MKASEETATSGRGQAILCRAPLPPHPPTPPPLSAAAVGEIGCRLRLLFERGGICAKQSVEREGEGGQRRQAHREEGGKAGGVGWGGAGRWCLCCGFW